MVTRTGFAAVLFLATLPLAGCGGGSSAATSGAMAYIPADATSAVVAYPARVLAYPEVAKLDLAEQLKSITEETGLDPKDCEQIIVVAKELMPKTLSVPGPDDAHVDSPDPPLPAMIVVATSPVDRKAIIEKLTKGNAKESKHGSHTIHTRDSPGGNNPSLAFADEKTILIAREPELKKMLDKPAPKTRLTELLGKIDAKDDLSVVVADFTEAQNLVKNELPPAEQLGPAAPFAEIPNLLSAATYGVRASPEIVVKLSLEGKDSASAEKLETLMTNAKGMAEGFIAIGKFSINPQQMGPEEFKMASGAMEIADKAVKGMDPKRSGNWVTMSVNAGKLETVTELLGPAIEKARDAAKRTAAMSNLRQISLALLNYESSFNKLPLGSIQSADGKPLLSWRVAILPYLEENTLYKEFKLDEPWDSDHNKALITKMPAVFNPVNSAAAKEGKTRYLGVAGPNGVFGAKEAVRGFGGIPDGSSKTVLVVEVGEDKAVPWTKPDDLVPDDANPAAALGNIESDTFLAVFSDGHVERIKKSAPAEALKAIFSYKGGEEVDRDVLRAD